MKERTRGKMKSFYKKLVVLLAMVGVAVLGLSIIKPVNAAVTTPVVSNLKAQANGQKVTFSFDWDLRFDTTGVTVAALTGLITDKPIATTLIIATIIAIFL